MPTSRVRGVSSNILVFIPSIILILAMSYLILDVISHTQLSIVGLKKQVGYSSLHELYSLVLDERPDGVYLFNAGVNDIVIDKVIATAPNGTLVAMNPLSLCNSSIIPSGSYIVCNLNYEYNAVVTREGAIIRPETTTRNIRVKEATVKIIPISFNMQLLEDLVTEFNVTPDLVALPTPQNTSARGVTGTFKVLRCPSGRNEDSNASVITDSPGVAFGVAVIGYDPSWLRERESNPNSPPRFRVMIASPGFTGQEKIRVGKNVIPITGLGDRALFINFTGTIKIYNETSKKYIACVSSIPGECSGIPLSAIGTWYYGYTGLNLRIYLNGFVSTAIYFQRMQRGDVQETSYYPYLFIGDIDGNGLVDFIFTTEDAYFGNISTINDFYNNDDVSDYSTEPLTLRLLAIGKALGSSDGSIDGSTYSGLLMLFNVFFHDNSYPDTQQIDEQKRTDWVLRVDLVAEDGTRITVREYRYQEIANYHKTLVTDFTRDNYYIKISQSLFIPIPGSGKYWVEIAFQDPYGLELWNLDSQIYYINDADLTVGLEIIGVIPFIR